MKTLAAAIQQWFETIPPGKRWIVWAFAILMTAFTFLLAATSSSAGLDPAANPTSTTAVMAFDILVKLFVVILLIFVSAAAYQRWNRRALAQPQKWMKVRETARLSARQALHVVQVGDDTFLIGATDQNITLISVIEVGEASSLTTQEPAASFLSILASKRPTISGLEK